MEPKEFISSGLIELYACGCLNDDEAAEVELFIRNYPEVRNEYNEIQKALYLSASQIPLIPNENIRKSLLEKVKVQPELNKYQKNSFHPEKDFGYIRYLAAASAAFLVISLITNFFLWNKLKVAESEIASLNVEKKIITQDYEAVNRKLSQSSHDMQIMKDRNYKMVELKGMEKSPGSSAAAFWNPDSKKLFIQVSNLPPPPPHMQYQLWALDNGKPEDAGTMAVDPSDKSLHPMKNVENADAFAITLEPEGGSKTPDMSEMYAMGKI